MPKPAKTTATKKNAYRIRSAMSQRIFREFIAQQTGDVMYGTVFCSFNRSLLSCVANLATSAVMNDPNFDVVLKKGGL